MLPGSVRTICCCLSVAPPHSPHHHLAARPSRSSIRAEVAPKRLANVRRTAAGWWQLCCVAQSILVSHTVPGRYPSWTCDIDGDLRSGWTPLQLWQSRDVLSVAMQTRTSRSVDLVQGSIHRSAPADFLLSTDAAAAGARSSS